MNLNKRFISKALCFSAVCCILATNISYADFVGDTRAKLKENKAELSSVKHNNVEYISKLLEMSTNQIIVGKLDDAEKSLKKIDKIFEEDKLQDSELEFYTDLKYAHLYNEFKKPDKNIEALKKAKNILDKNQKNKDMYKDYYNNLAYFENSYDMQPNGVKSLEKAMTYINSKSIDEIANSSLHLARTYLEFKDFYNTNKNLNKAYKLMKNNPELFNRDYANYYTAKMLFHKEKGELKKVLPLYEEAKKIAIKNNIQKEFEENEEFITVLLNYYMHMDNIDKIRELLDKNLEEAKKANNINRMEFTYGEYITYYKRLKDVKATKAALEKRNSLRNKKYDSDSLESINEKNDYLDFYNFAKEYEKAEKYAEEIVAIAEPYKDVIPARYAFTQKKLAEAYKETKKIDKALKAVATAQEYYKKTYPEISHRIYRTEKIYGDIYKKAKKYDDALKHYKKALFILNKLHTIQGQDHIDIYEEIAENYKEMGNSEKALTIINKAIKISIDSFGQNNITTISLERKKAEIYQSAQQYVLAKNKVNNILNKIDTKVIKYPVDNESKCYKILAEIAYAESKYDDALAYATKALKTACTKENKDDANKIITKVYKAQDKKFKAFKQKIKSKI